MSGKAFIHQIVLGLYRLDLPVGSNPPLGDGADCLTQCLDLSMVTVMDRMPLQKSP